MIERGRAGINVDLLYGHVPWLNDRGGRHAVARSAIPARDDRDREAVPDGREQAGG
jgi:hypothetical protein